MTEKYVKYVDNDPEYVAGKKRPYVEKEFPSYPEKDGPLFSEVDLDPSTVGDNVMTPFAPTIKPLVLPVSLSGTTIVVQPTEEQARITAVFKAQEAAKQVKADEANAKALVVDRAAVDVAIAEAARDQAAKVLAGKKAAEIKLARSKASKVVTNQEWDELIRALKSARIL